MSQEKILPGSVLDVRGPADVQCFQNHYSYMRVPFDCRPSLNTLPNFHSVSELNGTDIDSQAITANLADQTTWFTNWCYYPIIEPVCIGISSAQNDRKALVAAAQIANCQQNMGMDCSFINVAWENGPALSQPDDDGNPTQLVVLYNFTTMSTRERIQLTRDFLTYYHTAVRIVTIGDFNPIRFFKTWLQHPISYALNIR